MDLLVKGALVRIKSSRYHDVQSGTTGTLDGPFEKGYGVEINGRWVVAGSDRGATVNEKRVMWYPAKEIELIYCDTGVGKNGK